MSCFFRVKIFPWGISSCLLQFEHELFYLTWEKLYIIMKKRGGGARIYIYGEILTSSQLSSSPSRGEKKGEREQDPGCRGEPFVPAWGGPPRLGGNHHVRGRWIFKCIGKDRAGESEPEPVGAESFWLLGAGAAKKNQEPETLGKKIRGRSR